MALFRTDDFLSGVLGVDAYWVTSVPAPGESASFWEEADSILSGGPVFATAKVDVDNVAGLRVLERGGFSLVDTNVTLERIGREPILSTWAGTVDTAEDADRDTVAKLSAANLVASRFHLDPLMNGEVAAKVKAQWADNYFAGQRGDAMLVAKQDGVCAGFLQLLTHGADLIIDLVAVDSSFRRSGAASAMIQTALEAHPSCQRVVVGTQAANVGSLRFYQSIGFTFSGAKYVLHSHGVE